VFLTSVSAKILGTNFIICCFSPTSLRWIVCISALFRSYLYRNTIQLYNEPFKGREQNKARPEGILFGSAPAEAEWGTCSQRQTACCEGSSSAAHSLQKMKDCYFLPNCQACVQRLSSPAMYQQQLKPRLL